MNKEDLSKLGLTAENLAKAGLSADVLDQVIILHGKDIEDKKTAITNLTTERDTLKGQLEEAGKKVESFKGMKTQADVDAAVEQFKADAQKAKADADAMVAQVKLNSAVELALNGAKVRNAKSALANLDMTKVKFGEDGKLTGLEDQVKALRESDPYLFSDIEEKDPRIIAGGGGGTSVVSDKFTNAAREAAGVPAGGDKK